MRVAKIFPVVVGCLLLLGIWYWQTHLTYAGEVSRFESKVRNQVDPDQLQQWAVATLARYSTSRVENASFAIDKLPDYLKSLHRLPPVAFAFPGTSDKHGHVRVTWGSGFRGHWGLAVGATNFDSPYGGDPWRPGLYFWRSDRQ
jgi:hypothetical protein